MGPMEILSSEPPADDFEEAAQNAILAAGKLIDEQSERIELLEERIESQEQLLTQLTMGYQELNTAFEVLCWKIFGSDPEAEADFREKMDTARSAMMGWLRDSVKYMGFSDEDLADTVGSLLQSDEPPDQRYRRSAGVPDESDS